MLKDSEEAQDVAQETFIRLWRAGMAEAPAAQAVAWMYRTSTRLAIDRLRGDKVRTAGPVAGGEEPSANPSAEVAIHTRQLLELLAREIPPAELELAILDRLDGLTQRESAEVLGVSERTVRRGLLALDERLARLRNELLT